MNPLKMYIRFLIAAMGLFLSSALLGQPSNWEFSITSENHTLVIPATASLTIGGQPIALGSYIGAFYQANNGSWACAGYVQWEGENTSLAIFGDDGDLPGYLDNEPFTLYIWQPDGCTIQQTQTTYASGGIYSHVGNFTPNGISGISTLEGQTLTEIMRLDSIGPLCTNGNGFALDIGFPSGGNYSGTGVVGDSLQLIGLSAGSYSLAYSLDTNGCTGNISTTYVIESAPETPVIQLEGQDSLYVSTTGLDYQWYVDGNLVAGRGQGIKPTQEGSYQVRVSTENCLSDLSAPFEFMLTHRGIASLPGVELFPIPIKDELWVKWPQNSGKPSYLSIRDGLGREVFATQLWSSPQQISLKHLSSGVFSITLQTGSASAVYRIIKE